MRPRGRLDRLGAAEQRMCPWACWSTASGETSSRRTRAERPVHAADDAVPQLDHRGRQSRPDRQGRLRGRARAISSLCLARLPVGAPHADLPRAEGTGRRHLGLGRRSAHGAHGWTFGDSPGTIDTSTAAISPRSICGRSAYTGRVTVPVLWDKESRTIVNNESSEIIRMFNGVQPSPTAARLLSGAFAAEIDRVNDLVYARQQRRLRAGFATTQGAYEEAFRELFAALDEMEPAVKTALSAGGRSPRPTGGCSPR